MLDRSDCDVLTHSNRFPWFKCKTGYRDVIIRTLNPDFQITPPGHWPGFKKINESFNTITKGLVFFLNISCIYSGLKYKFNTNLNEVHRVIYMLSLCPHNKTTIYILVHDKLVSNHISGLREPQNGTVRWQLKLGFLLQSQFFLRRPTHVIWEGTVEVNLRRYDLFRSISCYNFQVVILTFRTCTVQCQ